MSTFTLTRSEAYAVSVGLVYTRDGGLNPYIYTRDDCYATIRRLQLEATIRDAGNWWQRACPSMLVQYASNGGPAVPETFALEAAGVSPMIELLPSFLGRIEEERAYYVFPVDWFVEPKSAAQREEDVAEWLADGEARREALESLAARLGVEIAQPVA